MAGFQIPEDLMTGAIGVKNLNQQAGNRPLYA